MAGGLSGKGSRTRHVPAGLTCSLLALSEGLAALDRPGIALNLLHGRLRVPPAGVTLDNGGPTTCIPSPGVNCPPVWDPNADPGQPVELPK